MATHSKLVKVTPFRMEPARDRKIEKEKFSGYMSEQEIQICKWLGLSPKAKAKMAI